MGLMRTRPPWSSRGPRLGSHQRATFRFGLWRVSLPSPAASWKRFKFGRQALGTSGRAHWSLRMSPSSQARTSAILRLRGRLISSSSLRVAEGFSAQTRKCTSRSSPWSSSRTASDDSFRRKLGAWVHVMTVRSLCGRLAAMILVPRQEVHVNLDQHRHVQLVGHSSGLGVGGNAEVHPDRWLDVLRQE